MKLFFDNTLNIIRYIFIWIVYAAIHTFVFYWLFALPLSDLLIHAVIHASLFATVGFLLMIAMHFGNYHSLPLLQKVINYLTLYVLGATICLGGAYAIVYSILGKDSAEVFLPAIPLLALVSLLLFMILVLHYVIFLLRRSEEEMTEENRNEESKIEINEDPEEQSIEELERVVVRIGQKIHVVLLPEILYLQSDGDYVQIHTEKGKYLKEQTMKYYERNLPSQQFIRVHRSFIVNVEYISRIELFEKQNQLILLKDGQRIKMSAAGYKLLRSTLGL